LFVNAESAFSLSHFDIFFHRFFHVSPAAPITSFSFCPCAQRMPVGACRIYSRHSSVDFSFRQFASRGLVFSTALVAALPALLATSTAVVFRVSACLRSHPIN
jgi:hypothetical protein